MDASRSTGQQQVLIDHRSQLKCPKSRSPMFEQAICLKTANLRSLQGLKGSDKILFDLLQVNDWSCRLLPVLVVAEQRRSIGYDCDSYESSSQHVFSFTKQDFEFLNVRTRSLCA